MIPISAALIALGAATIGLLTFRRSGRTAVTVEITQMASSAPITMLNGDASPEPVYPGIKVAVINRGPVAESVTFLAVEQAGEGSERAGYDITGFPAGRGDREVGVRRRIAAETALAALGFDPSDGFFRTARRAPGKRVRSSVESPDPDVVTHITRHNRRARP